MEMVNIKINGMPLSVPSGISILEAAQNRRKMLEEEFEKSTDGDPDADTPFVQDTETFIQQNSYAENQWNQMAETGDYNYSNGESPLPPISPSAFS